MAYSRSRAPVRLVPLALSAGLVCVVGGLAASCASQSTGFPQGDGGSDSSLFGDTAADVDVPACATGVYEAKQAPAAMLVVLQRSGSMSQNNKWVFAAQAVVQALDANVFDTMTLGLMAAPSSLVKGPSCIFGADVACGVPAFPQVDLTAAGTNKSSDATGVRKNIKTWLTGNAPDNSAGEGNPLYSAIQSGIGTLKGWAGPGKRILFVVTDGGISCTSLSSRTTGFTDGNGCKDWENPNEIIKLVKTANTDPNSPIDTFILGVPGSDSYDATGVSYPPYRMRAALSSIAYAGSPTSAPTGCTHTDPFAQGDPNPTTSCHFDMTQNYSTQAVSDAISLARGKVLGCIFDLPKADGGLIDPGKVNVDYTVGANPKVNLYKRSSSSNDCTTDGCWDYTNDGKVQLIGKACDDVKGKPNAKVSITVGCDTQVK